MSSSSSPVLVLDLPHSWPRWLPAGMLLSTSLVMPWLADIATPWFAFVILISGALFGFTLWKTGYGQPARRLVRVSWQQNHEWRLQFAVGEAVSASLLGSSWLSASLMCLQFRDMEGRSQQFMVWRKQLSATAWHQWQLRLRLEAGQAVTPMTPGLLH